MMLEIEKFEGVLEGCRPLFSSIKALFERAPLAGPSTPILTPYYLDLPHLSMLT
jgi:hypothetical protein